MPSARWLCATPTQVRRDQRAELQRPAPNGYAGITGATGAWLWLAAALVGVESAIFLGNGLKCPLTAVAAKYGAGDAADTFLPERITRHTFRVFAPLILMAVALIAARGLSRLR
jgi:hypothetical protein